MPRFQRGHSGNPGGRPKEDGALRAAARGHTEAALGVLVAALKDTDARVRLAAANAILDRGHGKATQAIAGDRDRAPIVIQLDATDSAL